MSISLGVGFKGNEGHMSVRLGEGFGQMTAGWSRTDKGQIYGEDYSYTGGAGALLLLPVVAGGVLAL
jgi:hypothetical protein